MFKKILFLFSISVSVFAQERNSIDKIVAKVDNYIVLRSDVEQIYQRGVAQNQPTSKCQALESMVVNKLLVAKAEIDSVTVEDKMVNNQLDGRMQMMAQQFGSEKNIVEAYGKSIETLKSELRQQVKEQMLAQKMQQTITEATKITPEEVKNFFTKIPKDSLPYLPAEAEVGHIVRFAKATKAQKQELRNKLLEIKRRVEKGEKFEKLAAEFSEDVGSRESGGNLGFAKRGMMVAPFEAAAMKLKPNDLSDIVESEFGFHLIQLLEIRGQEYNSRHILLRPDYNRLDLSEPQRFLDSLRTLIQRDSTTFDKAARDFSEDKATSDSGGLIADEQTGSFKLALDQSMEFTMYFTLDSMKVGTITVPMNYRNPDGKTGMRIMYYKKRYEPHTASLKYDFEKLSQYALMEKKNTAIDVWFKKAVKDVFIKIEPEFQACNLFGRTSQ